MNARLRTIISDAESRLAPEDQDALADLLEAFLTNRGEEPRFTPEELAHLTRIAGEPFEPASAEEVAAYFRRGA